MNINHDPYANYDVLMRLTKNYKKFKKHEAVWVVPAETYFDDCGKPTPFTFQQTRTTNVAFIPDKYLENINPEENPEYFL